jgi:DNA invertase Pin-like site-specific DNA recombinase
VKVLGYVRCSTAEQTESGAGLAAQRAAIQSACDARELELLDIHEDAGWSAATLDRPGIATALRELDAHRADALMVSKLDRLSRSLMDFAALMDRSRKKGWAVMALDLGVDTTTPSGEMIASVMATFAHYERRLIGQRTKDALAAKRRSGVRLGRPSTVDLKAVERARGLRAKGASYAAIAEVLNAEGWPTAQGGKRWHASTVRAVLRGVPS